MDAKSFPEPILEKQLKGHRGGITALSFNPNEQQIASSALDKSVLLWDIRGTMRSYRFQGHDEAVTDVNFSPSGKYMASASRDMTVRIWVPTVTGSTGLFKAHSQTVRSVQFSSDATQIVTASDDKIIKLWSSERLKFIISFVGHTNWVRRASMSHDNSIIASCSDDKTTRLWNLESGQCIHTYKDQNGHGLYVAWHPSGCYIAVATSHGKVKLYDVRTHNLVQSYSIHSDAVTQVAFHPSGSYILTASKDGNMKILDILEGHPLYTLCGHSGAVNAVSFSLSGDWFASAGEDKLVFMWKTNFTQLGIEKENVQQNPLPTPTSRASSSTKGRNQAARIWFRCYHSTKYPVTTFVHIEDAAQSNNTSGLTSLRDVPNANSTMVEPNRVEPIHNSRYISTPLRSSRDQSNRSRTPRNWTVETENSEKSQNDVGNMSHLPRVPPTRATYTVPSLIDRSTEAEAVQDSLFGVIKLNDDDVCYTSGTIEWVGRKRSFPLNSGFKIFSEEHRHPGEPFLKKIKKFDQTYPNSSKTKDCDCADVLPTVNAIVDHLNALHEAVDLVNLRLDTLEDVASHDDE